MSKIVKPTIVDYVALLALSAVWGTSFIAVEFSLNSYSPLFVAFTRIFLAALFLLPIFFIKRLTLPKDIKSWIILAIAGITNNAAPFFFLSWGQQYVSSSTAAIMLAAGPFFTLLLSHILTQDEKFSTIKLISVILGFAGVFVLLGDDLLNARNDSLLGELSILLAILGYISSGLLLKKVSHVSATVCSIFMFTSASLVLSPFVLVSIVDEGFSFNNSFLVLIYLAIIPTALASLLRVRLVHKVGVIFMSQVAYLIPIFTIFWAWLFFDDTPKIAALFTLILVFLGLLIKKFEK